MTHLIYILLLSLICALFWQQRKQSELAKAAITRQAKQLNLQLLSTSFGQHKFKTNDKRWLWHTVYHFEFSALGDDSNQGQLIMQGFRIIRFNIPPYRISS